MMRSAIVVIDQKQGETPLLAAHWRTHRHKHMLACPSSARGKCTVATYAHKGAVLNS